MTISDPEDAARFIQLLTGVQSRLYAYICTLLAGAGEARDVLQETNVILWKKAGEFELSRPFEPWALRFAHFQVLAWRKRQSRDRLVLDDATLEAVAAEFIPPGSAEAELQALEICLQQLPEKPRALLERRYQQGEAVHTIAEQDGRPPNVIAALLYRTRKLLANCITSQLAGGRA